MNMRFGVKWVGLLVILGLLVTERNSAFAINVSIEPQVQSVCSGSNAEFTAHATGGTPPYFYSWSGPTNFNSDSQSISVGAVGNYSVSITDSAGFSFGPVCATFNLKERPILSIRNGRLTCVSSQIQLSAITSASNAVFSWSGPGIVSGGNTASPTVHLPGTYEVTVTAINGCSYSTNVVVVEDRQAPNLSVSTPETLNCTRTQVLLTASSTNLAIRYTWSGPGIVAGTNSATCTVNQPGLYTVTAHSPQMPLFFGALSAEGTIDFTNRVVVDTFDSGGTNVTFPFDTNRIRTPILVDTNDIYSGPYYGGYVIGNPPECSTATAPVVIDVNGNSRTLYTGNPGLNGHFNFHYDETLVSYGPSTGNGCSSIMTVMVLREAVVPPLISSPKDIGQPFVSFPQAFWAKGKGRLNKVPAAELMKWLLINPDTQTSEPLVVGKPGRSLSIPLNAVEWLHTRLPARGSVGPLPSFGDQVLSAATGQTSPTLPLNKKLNFENSLLGEVISFTLNLRLDDNLSDFDLAMEYRTKKALPGNDGLIGTEDDIIDWLGPDRLVNSGDEIEHSTIPASIFEALCHSGLPATPAGLLELGNRALAGRSPAPASYIELNAAISIVNESFEAGRYCVICE